MGDANNFHSNETKPFIFLESFIFISSKQSCVKDDAYDSVTLYFLLLPLPLFKSSGKSFKLKNSILLLSFLSFPLPSPFFSL